LNEIQRVNRLHGRKNWFPWKSANMALPLSTTPNRV